MWHHVTYESSLLVPQQMPAVAVPPYLDSRKHKIYGELYELVITEQASMNPMASMASTHAHVIIVIIEPGGDCLS